jgi:alpha-L-arabinofuranosidase
MRAKYFALTFFVMFTVGVLFTQSRAEPLTTILAAEQQDGPLQTTADIVIDVNGTVTTIDRGVLGTNLPAWLGPSRIENNTFLSRTNAAGPSIIRIPGGSWSNGYDWSSCENYEDYCRWALRPTDFINFLRASGTQGMYTVNMNGTAREAAALVAFFNGSVNDDTVIGTDINGHNWGKVSDWAKLRRDHGNPDPINIKYWEIGNEIYGGKPGLGTDCTFQWGWENVWTCDGTEYANGISGHEGFKTFRDEMRRIDPSIMVGAVGVSSQSSWNNWGNEVIAAAGSVMDFYIVHYYGFDNLPSSYQTALAAPQSIWQPIMANINTAFDQHANGRRVPIAVTEHNLVSVEGNDTGGWMIRAVNMLYMADTIGQMMKNGFDMANQWNLANGGDVTDYGMLDDDTYYRHPQYYVFPLWSKFGSNMIPVTSSYDAATTLSVYAGKIDPWTASVMVLNKTGIAISTNIEFAGAPALLLNGKADVAQAAFLDSTAVTYNEVSNPSNDLSNAPSRSLSVLTNPMPYTFPAYSVTLLRIGLEEFVAADWVYLPVTIR